MVMLKKLTFAPLFLLTFSILIFKLPAFLKSSDILFSVSISTFIQLMILSALISLSSFLFVVFTALSQNWKFSLPVGILASVIPFVFLETGLALVFAVAVLVSLVLTFLSLENSLKSYLTFQPNTLLTPSIRHLSQLLILTTCLVYFLSTNKIIAQNGFQIPDSLIDSALKFTPQLQSEQSEDSAPSLSIPKEQLELLKQNPQLLKQSGLDPKILDTLSQPQNESKNSPGTSDLLKQTIKEQVQNLIKPYQNYIPAVLSVLLFFTLQSLSSIIQILVYPLLWLSFLILEKSRFIKFEIAQRPVKKMVV